MCATSARGATSAKGARGAKGAGGLPRASGRAGESRGARVTARRATPADAEAIAAIYNEGIEDGIATFETRLRTADDVRKWFGGRFPIVVDRG